MSGHSIEFVTTAEINAPLESVWQVLTDAVQYSDWNPKIVGISGRMGLNEHIKTRVKVGGGAVRSVTLRVTAFEPPSRMEWTGGLPAIDNPKSTSSPRHSRRVRNKPLLDPEPIRSRARLNATAGAPAPPTTPAIPASIFQPSTRQCFPSVRIADACRTDFQD